MDAEKIVKKNPPLDVTHVEEKIVRGEKKEDPCLSIFYGLPPNIPSRGPPPLDVPSGVAPPSAPPDVVAFVAPPPSVVVLVMLLVMLPCGPPPPIALRAISRYIMALWVSLLCNAMRACSRFILASDVD